MLVNAMRANVQRGANPANNNTIRYEYEFIHKRIFKTVLFQKYKVG
jgi:hypothetical protein